MRDPNADQYRQRPNIEALAISQTEKSVQDSKEEKESQNHKTL